MRRRNRRAWGKKCSPRTEIIVDIDTLNWKLANVKEANKLGLLSGVKKGYIKRVLKPGNPSHTPMVRDLNRIPDIDWDKICEALNEKFKPTP